MTDKTRAEQTATTALGWLRYAILAMLLVSVVVILLRSFGVSIPLRGLGHVELAYLAGAYWLTK